MASLAQDEATQTQADIDALVSTTFPSLLVPSSPTLHLNALVEFKSGVGGHESALFLTELIRMYTRFSGSRHWKSTVIEQNELDGGGTKSAILEIKGKGKTSGVYDLLRWESGAHRVQRIPATDSQGRVHTSTVAVLVLPLVEEDPDAKEEPLYTMDEVKIEVMRARGAGGQHVNKTESAVRLTHLPTGITVSMQDERSQHQASLFFSHSISCQLFQNKRRAFQVLSSRLLDLKLTRELEEKKATRKGLVRSLDRSEKIRTYNYPQASHVRLSHRPLLKQHSRSA